MKSTWIGLAAVVALAGCGGGDAGASAEAGAVSIADFKYAPAKVTVQAGAKVAFANEDKAPHTATSQDKAFDTGTLKQGESRSVTLDKPGTYQYYCSFHRFMEGEIVVQ